VNWSVPKLCGIFLKEISGFKTIQTQNKFKKNPEKTNECFHSTMMTGPYHNMTCKLFVQSYIKTGLIAMFFQVQFQMYFNSLIIKIKYWLVVSARKNYSLYLDTDRMVPLLWGNYLNANGHPLHQATC
jgi:hypothetical protein